MKGIPSVFIVLSLFILFAPGCRPWVAYEGKHKWTKPIIKSNVFSRGSTGFALYDLEKEKWLSNYQGDKKFTPASNTKLMTILAAWKVFGNKIPIIDYLETKDSLLLRPTGFPGFGYGQAEGSAALDSLLAVINKPAKLIMPEDGPEPYGSGWSWDDSGYSYQVPRSVLPIFGNRLTLQAEQPGLYFADSLLVTPPDTSILINQFIDQQAAKSKSKIPFLPNREFIANHLWSKGKLEIIAEHPKDAEGFQTLEIQATSFYQQILEDSDNFVAEQLLIMASKEQLGIWEIEQFTKDFVANNFVNDPPAWVDGSGLSRYNAFSPEQMIKILGSLVQECGMEKLIEILPEAGNEGTLKESYQDIPAGHLYAKTGTLRHIHCLSGLLITKSKKPLIFSFMHNQIDRSNRDWKVEMSKQLLLFYEKY